MLLSCHQIGPSIVCGAQCSENIVPIYVFYKLCKKGRSYRISMYLVYLFYLLAHCECLVSNLHSDDSKEEVRLHTNLQ